jgi:heat shock protein HslJ
MQTGPRILLALLLTACTTSSANSVAATPVQSLVIPTLDNSSWKLVSMYGRSPIDGTTITLSFAHGILMGSAGCNSYGGGPDSGRYRSTLDGTLTITQTAVTVMRCAEPPGIMEQEDAYIDALHQAATYRIANGELEIFNKDGDAVLVFVRDG